MATRARREVRVRAVRRKEPDLRALARVLIELAMTEVEGEAAKEPETETTREGPGETATDAPTERASA